jgi:hypothetical protein
VANGIAGVVMVIKAVWGVAALSTVLHVITEQFKLMGAIVRWQSTVPLISSS